MPYLRQWFWLLPDLHAAHVDEGLRLQPGNVQDVVAVDQEPVELADHLQRAGHVLQVLLSKEHGA